MFIYTNTKLFHVYHFFCCLSHLPVSPYYCCWLLLSFFLSLSLYDRDANNTDGNIWAKKCTPSLYDTNCMKDNKNYIKHFVLHHSFNDDDDDDGDGDCWSQGLVSLCIKPNGRMRILASILRQTIMDTIRFSFCSCFLSPFSLTHYVVSDYSAYLPGIIIFPSCYIPFIYGKLLPNLLLLFINKVLPLSLEVSCEI